MKHAPSTEQLAIFDFARAGRGNLVVRARAGTGKTTTILAMLAFMPEQAILLAAFNKSIADELMSRIDNPRVEAKTLHGLGFKFVRYNWKDVKVDEDNKRALGLAKMAAPDAPDNALRLIKELHSKAREIKPFAATKSIKLAFNDLLDLAIRFNLVPDDDLDAQGWDLTAIVEAAHRAMGFAMQRSAVIDFADMIFLPLVMKWVRPWYNAVIIDEAQDMTDAQLTLAQQCCKRGGRVIVVGDDRQAIYAFRGADSGSIDRLKKQLNATELGLKTTYRCGSKIVDLAKTLVPDFVAAPGNPEGEILNADSPKMIETAKEGDFILSRTNAPLIRICMALLKKGTRARIKGRDIGKGIVTLIRKLRPSGVTDLPGLVNAWAAAEVEKAMEKMEEEAANDRIQFVSDQQGIIMALLEGAATIAELEARCDELFADNAERQAVMCSSVHRAKGLEANNVFLLQGTFRASKTGGSEEDNIKYVAITRAKQRLTWVTGYEKNVAA